MESQQFWRQDWLISDFLFPHSAWPLRGTWEICIVMNESKPTVVSNRVHSGLETNRFYSFRETKAIHRGSLAEAACLWGTHWGEDRECGAKGPCRGRQRWGRPVQSLGATLTWRSAIWENLGPSLSAHPGCSCYHPSIQQCLFPVFPSFHSEVVRTGWGATGVWDVKPQKWDYFLPTGKRSVLGEKCLHFLSSKDRQIQIE